MAWLPKDSRWLVCHHLCRLMQITFRLTTLHLYTGKGLRAISSIALLLLLVLLAKGFTVTRARLKPATSAKVAVFITLYAVIYACLFFYEQQVNNLRISPDGNDLMTWLPVLRSRRSLVHLRRSDGTRTHRAQHDSDVLVPLFAVAHFAPLSRQKILLHNSSSHVFCVVRNSIGEARGTTTCLLFLPRFISLPVVIAIATLAIPKFRREKIVNAVDLIVALRAHFFFMVNFECYLGLEM